MAAHASWKGHLRLSLVSIPLEAYTVNAGSSSSEVSFHQLHKPCKSRIQYKKFCPIHGEVSQDEIVSGYEIEKDHYVVLDPKEVDALRDVKDQMINIEGFVSPDTIDPRYLAGQAYYLVPDGRAGEKPFELMRRGLEEEQLHGIGRFVISRRQRLVRLRATEKLLLLDVLHYSSEIKAAEDFETTEQAVPAAELRLAKSLIQELSIKRFRMSDFKDEYAERVRKEVAGRAKGAKHITARKEKTPHVINLMDALQKSLREVKTPARSVRGAARVTKATRSKSTSRRKKVS